MNAPTNMMTIEQNPDIRYLGRLLGDVIREHDGDVLFDRIETIRSASVDRHRGLAQQQDLVGELEALTLDSTLAFVRGFMLFSLLANLAEDRQGVAADPGATLADASARLMAAGIGQAAIADFLDGALVAPVLTAHPTEVRRKSMIDHRGRIAELMRLRDAGATETADGDDVEAAIRRHITFLWQTRPLRRERLYVADEVEIALSYLTDVFLPVLPALYARWERALGFRPTSFLRIGSWIGGDADGNPNVTADTLEFALGSASEALLGDYLDQVHALGADLSISQELAAVTPAVLQLAEMSGDEAPARRDEPYRRALSGMYARLAATMKSITGRQAHRASSIEADPYPGPEAFKADLLCLAEGLGNLEGGALRRLIRSVETFGFHLATVDLRQNAEVHERVVGELLKCAHVDHDYAALPESERVFTLRRELSTPRLLANPYANYSDETKAQLAMVRAAVGGDGKPKRVTFIDTPGHQAFTGHGARGANMTDVVVLVVAADEGVMPQTIESINHAKAADVPIVVALNKIDKPEANPNKVLGQLAEQGLNPVEWGGDTEVVRTSAVTGQGIKELIEFLDYTRQLKELKADPTAAGTRRGDRSVHGSQPRRRGDACWCRMARCTSAISSSAARPTAACGPSPTTRASTIQEAGPSSPVDVIGLDEVPGAGDKFFVDGRHRPGPRDRRRTRA